MTLASHAARAASAGPGQVVACFEDLLPEAVAAHRDFAAILAYLHALDPDVASFCHYIEWNLRTRALDVTFSFPTLFAGSVRLRVQDLARSLAPAAAPGERGQRLLESAIRQMQATPIDAPQFPRALSISVESIGRPGAHPGVDFVFLDYGPLLDLASEPAWLARAFAFLEPPEPLVQRERSLERLARVSEGLALAHVGMGWRRGACLHKVYLRGRFPELLAAVHERGPAPFISAHAPDLEGLARSAGSRVAHLVVDETAGQLARIGFELNFDVDAAEGFAELATRSALWQRALPEDLRAAAEALLALGAIRRPLPDGSLAELRTSHLKLSFDASGTPEWKAYLCFQKSLAG